MYINIIVRHNPFQLSVFAHKRAQIVVYLYYYATVDVSVLEKRPPSLKDNTAAWTNDLRSTYTLYSR